MMDFAWLNSLSTRLLVGTTWRTVLYAEFSSLFLFFFTTSVTPNSNVSVEGVAVVVESGISEDSSVVRRNLCTLRVSSELNEGLRRWRSAICSFTIADSKAGYSMMGASTPMRVTKEGILRISSIDVREI